jgi:hypothetical protein
MEALKELSLEWCAGVRGTAAGMAVFATMQLVRLYISELQRDDWTDASLQSFVGSSISQTLESFELSADGDATPIDDIQIATDLASCHNLKTLTVCLGENDCVFGRDGLDGLQAMATGCPLLADIGLYVTLPGLHYLATHFTNLKKCRVFNADPELEDGFPSIEELQTLYPAVKWGYCCA